MTHGVVSSGCCPPLPVVADLCFLPGCCCCDTRICKRALLLWFPPGLPFTRPPGPLLAFSAFFFNLTTLVLSGMTAQLPFLLSENRLPISLLCSLSLAFWKDGRRDSYSSGTCILFPIWSFLTVTSTRAEPVRGDAEGVAGINGCRPCMETSTASKESGRMSATRTLTH